MRESITIWMLLTKSGTPRYAGNTGYPDQPERHYVYDINVPNHRRVSVGDLVFLRDESRVIGAGIVERIDSEVVPKTYVRCPQCHTTTISRTADDGARKVCRNGHIFDEGESETREVRRFRAVYESSFVPLPEIELSELMDARKPGNPRLSIREVEPVAAERLLRRTKGGDRLLSQLGGQKRARESRGETQTERSPSVAPLAARRLTCMATECLVPEAIETIITDPDDAFALAARIDLRADLARLYRAGLLRIRSEDDTWAVDPKLVATEYAFLHGRRVVRPHPQ